MKDFFTKVAMKHILIFRIFVLCISIFLVTYLMPREIRFKYEYAEGKPWQYDNLYADFPFSIKKNQQEIEEEHNKIIEQAKQYYYKDTLIVNKQKNIFRSNLELFKNNLYSIKDSSDNYYILSDTNVTNIRSIVHNSLAYLDKVYNQGILKNATLKESNLWLKKRLSGTLSS